MAESGPCGPEPADLSSAERDDAPHGDGIQAGKSPSESAASDFYDGLASCGERFAQAGVLGIFLTHGTFAGNDALGLVTELARFAPGLSAALQRAGKGLVDAVAGETGNFTAGYAARLERGLSAGAGRSIPVRLFNWSSQNNHVGRADGAARLLVELARVAAALPSASWAAGAKPPRMQLWGHSHGGNVFAVLTNLLAADAAGREEFFAAARSFHRSWFSGRIDMPEWGEAEAILAETDHPVRRLALDIVTFGTPVRYGWDPGGYAKLLHFINHRPVAGLPEYLAKYPPHVGDVLAAVDGDYVQQIGVAGTNLCVNPLAMRTYLANRRLGQLLQQGMPSEWLRTRLKRGVRVPEDGRTWLVDYADPAKLPPQHLLGHALYTRTRWMLWHCERIAECFYTAEGE